MADGSRIGLADNYVMYADSGDFSILLGCKYFHRHGWEDQVTTQRPDQQNTNRIKDKYLNNGLLWVEGLSAPSVKPPTDGEPGFGLEASANITSLNEVISFITLSSHGTDSLNGPPLNISWDPQLWRSIGTSSDECILPIRTLCLRTRIHLPVGNLSNHARLSPDRINDFCYLPEQAALVRACV